ncbi:putative epithelial chloride channel protein-like [Apostichopus japonicus]|uniref:Putative epithelial chloride channel protein-like n=1 Tax=Stichopus japonicus TaxID=307972 RepID=A0A2G8K5P9_STIJA|nr:putative epithelial chloride channel protein-like [Apostichopus japonicus]
MNPSYEESAGHSFSASDVRIDRSTFEGSNNINQPYTHKATACGSPGRYIRLTPEYITDDVAARPYGDRSKREFNMYSLLHVSEFVILKSISSTNGSLQMGSFDEYPLRGDDHFYAAGNGEFEATKCVAAIPGQMRTPDGKECTELPDGAPDQDCRFFDSDGASESYEGSLMYKQFLSQVLRSHSDFPDDVPNNAPSVNGLPQVNIEPTFRLLKRRVTALLLYCAGYIW